MRSALCLWGDSGTQPPFPRDCLGTANPRDPNFCVGRGPLPSVNSITQVTPNLNVLIAQIGSSSFVQNFFQKVLDFLKRVWYNFRGPAPVLGVRLIGQIRPRSKHLFFFRRVCKVHKKGSGILCKMQNFWGLTSWRQCGKIFRLRRPLARITGNVT